MSPSASSSVEEVRRSIDHSRPSGLEEAKRESPPPTRRAATAKTTRVLRKLNRAGFSDLATAE